MMWARVNGIRFITTKILGLGCSEDSYKIATETPVAGQGEKKTPIHVVLDNLLKMSLL